LQQGTRARAGAPKGATPTKPASVFRRKGPPKFNKRKLPR
jgi:hypothetical protein